uniref:Uncharacterized protein n=1 Tax=Helianthus annuus TaxID=4232 RepID=A0A251U0T4_HELAN
MPETFGQVHGIGKSGSSVVRDVGMDPKMKKAIIDDLDFFFWERKEFYKQGVPVVWSAWD